MLNRMHKLIALGVLAMAAFAGDINGTWETAIKLNYGGGNATFVLHQNGEKLTGTYKGALGQSDVAGTVKGNAAEWHFDHARLGKIQFEGTVQDDKIEGRTQYGKYVHGTFIAQRKR